MTPTTPILGMIALLSALPIALPAGETCSASGKAQCSASQVAATGKQGLCCAANGKEVVFKVKGVGCAESATQLGLVAARLDGIQAMETCGQSHLTKISYDSSTLCTAKILAHLKQVGYTVEAEQFKVAVDGLQSETCSGKVAEALTKLQGVTDAQVCHVGKQAVVMFDPEKLTEDQILAAIDSTGFKASREAVN